MFKLFTPFEQLEIKTDDKRPGWFKGYGATFNNVDLGRDVIMPGAFDETLAEYEKSGLMPSMYYSHNSNEPIGDWLKMSIDKKGLLMEGQLWIDNPAIGKAHQAHKMLGSKTGKGLSIGFNHNKPPTYDDKKQVRYLHGIGLDEVSPTSRPMNPKATITGIKSLLTDGGGVISVRQAEDALRDVCGMSEAEAKEFIAGLTKSLRATWEAKHVDLSTVHDVLKELRDSIKPA